MTSGWSTRGPSPPAGCAAGAGPWPPVPSGRRHMSPAAPHPGLNGEATSSPVMQQIPGTKKVQKGHKSEERSDKSSCNLETGPGSGARSCDMIVKEVELDTLGYWEGMDSWTASVLCQAHAASKWRISLHGSCTTGTIALHVCTAMPTLGAACRHCLSSGMLAGTTRYINLMQKVLGPSTVPTKDSITHRRVIVQLPHVWGQGRPPLVLILPILPTCIQALQMVAEAGGSSASQR
jgi:hypothetical protein